MKLDQVQAAEASAINAGFTQPYVAMHISTFVELELLLPPNADLSTVSFSVFDRVRGTFIDVTPLKWFFTPAGM